VSRKGTKQQQNNPGNLFHQQNWQVKSTMYSRTIEFELTQSFHVKGSTTVSICFKTPPPDMVLEAWRILRHVADDRALFPAAVRAWHLDVRRMYADAPVPEDATCCSSDGAKSSQDGDVAAAAAGCSQPLGGRTSDALEVAQEEPRLSRDGDSEFLAAACSLPLAGAKPEAAEPEQVAPIHNSVLVFEAMAGEEIQKVDEIASGLYEEEVDFGGSTDTEHEFPERVTAPLPALQEPCTKPLADDSPRSLWVPCYLRQHEAAQQAPSFLSMQALKQRAVEHVRWRSDTERVIDPAMEVLIVRCTAELETHPMFELWTSPVPPDCGKAWIDKMWRRNRQAVQGLRDNQDLCREEYGNLFLDLPSIIAEKYGATERRNDTVELCLTEDACGS
jgi:hypothetical protein